MQTQIYYNARAALREDQPTEAVKLWLLRNTLESTSGQVSRHDPDFRSVTWAALGDLGLCQDGLPPDKSGAGLWPIAVHNWLVRTQGRALPNSVPAPFDAFRVGRQRRSVSVRDVLDADELAAVRFQRRGCLRQRQLLLHNGLPFGDLSDRKTRVIVLRSLLRQALETLAPDRIVGRAAVEARIFDLNLVLAGLSGRESRRAQRQASGDDAKTTRTALTRKKPPLAPDTEQTRIVLDSLHWNAEEWMSLSVKRRLFLFSQARQAATDPLSLHRLQLSIIDALIESRQGAELHTWLAWMKPAESQSLTTTDDGKSFGIESVWGASRGEKLLSLDPETGFRERAAIALPRGVHFLAVGNLPEALRALAYALRWAEDSNEPQAVRSLSLRWLSYVAGQFQATESLLLMLRNVLPRGDFARILEDQLWHAALAADSPSFEQCLQHQPARTALTQRAALLRQLSMGDGGAFVNAIDQALEQTPYFAEKMVRQLLSRLQAEDASVRIGQVPMLRELEIRLVRKALTSNATRQKTTSTMLGTLRAICEGAEGRVGETEAARAQVLSPERQVFAGSLRLAPSDPMPWPFVVAPLAAPPAFSPLSLRPEEWRGPDGRLIFGWRVGDL